MWDNPRLLNAAAGLLVGLALCAFALAGVHAALRSPLFPVRSVTVLTPLERAPREAVARALARSIDGNFFGLRIGKLRRALEQVPWVRRAEVRRVWPDRLEVRLEEHVALARWAGGGAVNTYGERFAGAASAELPLFVGPEGSEAEIAARYPRFARLLEPLGSPLERVVLTPRYAWQLRLANGLNLMLGRDADLAEQRLARFVSLYPRTLGRMPGRHEYVDLRYTNGFAVRVKG
ncbi:MAG TPA: cell division protein FtsQ/DivIB [Burkholderiales bacterium]